MAADQIVFWVFAPVSIGSAIAMLFQRNAIHAALFLIVNFFSLAVFYLVLGAPFLFAVQIIVYAGAIMVLFLFVIMLLGVDRDESLVERLRGQRPLAILLGLGLAAELVAAFWAGVGFAAKGPANFDQVVNRGGNTQALSRVLFEKYFLPFEVTSILLIIAAIGAMVHARRSAAGPAVDAPTEGSRREQPPTTQGILAGVETGPTDQRSGSGATEGPA